jgi:DNA-binding response OmpR family regulator
MTERGSRNGRDPLDGMCVLVVEDDFLILSEIEATLRDAGADVAGPCRSVAAALRRAEGEDITVAILDLRVGRETVAPVARLLARRGVPFIFYTGQIESDALRDEWSAARFVAKPATSREIVAAVVAAVRG